MLKTIEWVNYPILEDISPENDDQCTTSLLRRKTSSIHCHFCSQLYLYFYFFSLCFHYHTAMMKQFHSNDDLSLHCNWFILYQISLSLLPLNRFSMSNAFDSVILCCEMITGISVGTISWISLTNQGCLSCSPTLTTLTSRALILFMGIDLTLCLKKKQE